MCFHCVSWLRLFTILGCYRKLVTERQMDLTEILHLLPWKRETSAFSMFVRSACRAGGISIHSSTPVLWIRRSPHDTELRILACSQIALASPGSINFNLGDAVSLSVSLLQTDGTEPQTSGQCSRQTEQNHRQAVDAPDRRNRTTDKRSMLQMDGTEPQTSGRCSRQTEQNRRQAVDAPDRRTRTTDKRSMLPVFQGQLTLGADSLLPIITLSPLSWVCVDSVLPAVKPIPCDSRLYIFADRAGNHGNHGCCRFL